MTQNKNPENAGNPDPVSLPPDKWFYFAHGRKAASIEELKDAFESMEDAEFRHHVSNEKNDFANWVEGVFGEKELAKNLREVADREGSLILIEDFLNKKHHKHAAHRAARHKKTEERTREEMPEATEEDAEEREREAVVEVSEEGAEEVKKAAAEPEEVTVPEHKKRAARKRILPPLPPGDEDIPAKEEAQPSPGKILSENEIRKIVMEAKEALVDEEKKVAGWIKPKSERLASEMHHHFVVKEFIYGFILGLIFGLVMLGVIANLRA